MVGYLISKNKKECFGCGACFQICPIKAIRMEKDREGFLYPKIDDKKCVTCNSCHEVCPVENKVQRQVIKNTFVGYYIDEQIRKNSSSGGAFKGIVDAAPINTLFFGVEWKDRVHAIHSIAVKEEAYLKFSKSKYVQSSTEYTYRETKKVLDRNGKVVYIGTPCQIAGLKKFLKEDRENLLCIDLICHGVSSSDVLERYCIANEKGKNSIVGIDFREKVQKKENIDSKCAVLHYRNGKERIVDYDKSGYLRGFANGLFFRPSCSVCPFACDKRISDLTIGDAWGIEKEKLNLNPHQGVSLILVNNNKGEQWMERVQKVMVLYKVSTQQMVSENGRLKCPDKGHINRQDFFNRYVDEDFEKLVQDLIPRISLGRKIGHKIKEMKRRLG